MLSEYVYGLSLDREYCIGYLERGGSKHFVNPFLLENEISNKSLVTTLFSPK